MGLTAGVSLEDARVSPKAARVKLTALVLSFREARVSLTTPALRSEGEVEGQSDPIWSSANAYSSATFSMFAFTRSAPPCPECFSTRRRTGPPVDAH